MTDLAAVVIGAAFVSNFVLVQFLGLCPFLGTTRKLTTAVGMATATAAVLVVASLCGWLLETQLLVPLGLEYLRLLVFVVTIAALVQLAEIVCRHAAPLLHAAVGVYLPLITTNCAILGAMLLIVREPAGLATTLAYAIGVALGFGLAVIVFAAMRERLESPRVPPAFRGAPIAMVSAGLMALGLAGLAGIA